MTTYSFERFIREDLDLTGHTYHNCLFYACRLTLRIDPAESFLLDSTVVDCKFAGDGWPWDIAKH